MQKYVLFLLLMLIPGMVFSQFSDDFSDGDFTNNPAWVGDMGKFIIQEGMLRLNDQVAGTARLATPSSIIDNVQWEFWVRLAFTPSNNNHPRIYLVSDRQDLSGELKGYYIRIGKDGGDNKRIYFYRQDGGQSTEIMAGNANIATTTNNRIRIRITRDAEGTWTFFADPQGNHLFVPQGSVTDNTHRSSSWFGIHCFYTISNANRFYFDDFVVGETIQDTDPPTVVSVIPTSGNMVDIHFSEVVAQSTAEAVNNYSVSDGLGNPLIASRNPQRPNVVSLLFSSELAVNQLYEIHIRDVEDLAGNVMADYQGSFVLFIARPFDVVFNELMINPTPVVGLPAYEYVELYNTTDFPINLAGWIFQHGSTQRTLPPAMIQPKGYLLLVTEAAYSSLQGFGHVVAVPGLSGNALTNAGNDLLLMDHEETMVSFVSYSDQWFSDPAKRNGGWSLEKIDPYNFCQGAENWIASTDPRGGTPAMLNAVYAANPDTLSPDLVRVGVEDSLTITLFFSEPMHVASLTRAENFLFNQGLGQPLSAYPLLPDFSKVRLVLQEPLQPGVVYEVTVNDEMTDCAGNKLANRIARLALPQAADPFDVVINEVLFNPPDRGSRYIELYNRSGKVIDLKDHLITSMDTLSSYLTTTQEISPVSYLFFPGDYIVVTTDPVAVTTTFMTPNPGGIIRISGMPRMTNANGILVFASKSLQVIDQFVYTEDMHFALLTSFKGVALERLNPDRPTQDRSNWHSAAQSAGFGTPAFINSQYTLNAGGKDGAIVLTPEVFSPDGDGHDDLLNISYSFSEPGYVANVRIFDSRGRLIRFLARGELLATTGVITWDGTTDSYQKAAIGIYLVHLEIFDLKGNVKNHRKTAVLGGRF